MAAYSDQTFSNILNVVSVRTSLLNRLESSDRIKVSSLIERYKTLSSQRIKLVGKTYGSKKNQAKDELIHDQMKGIREQIEKLFKKPALEVLFI